MEHNSKLVEMTKTDNGYTLNNLNPFYIHEHIYELHELAKTGLVIYTESQKIATIENTAIILDIIKKASSTEKAKKDLMKQFEIQDCTAQHILDMPLDELSIFGAYTYESQIELYEEAVMSLDRLTQMQATIDAEMID